MAASCARASWRSQACRAASALRAVLGSLFAALRVSGVACGMGRVQQAAVHQNPGGLCVFFGAARLGFVQPPVGAVDRSELADGAVG